MEVFQEYYGLPPPPVGFGQPLHLSKGDIIELTRADADLSWWEVKFQKTSFSSLKAETATRYLFVFWSLVSSY